MCNYIVSKNAYIYVFFILNKKDVCKHITHTKNYTTEYNRLYSFFFCYKIIAGDDIMLEQINLDFKEAMKSGDKFTLSVLRMLKSALQMEGISLKKELEDKEIITVIKRNVKQRKDSILEYQKYNKTEEVENLEKEIAILSKYLPEELSEEKINEEIDKVFAELKPESIKDMGKVMKELTAKIGAVADMSLVSKKVKERFM